VTHLYFYTKLYRMTNMFNKSYVDVAAVMSLKVA